MGTQNYAPENGAPHPAPASGIFRPQVGLPEIVALAFDQGKMVTSRLDGSSQVLLTFTDGRRWYVPLFTADRIHQAGILARQQFEVTKLGRGINDWQIVPLCAQPGAAPGTVSPAPGTAGPGAPHNMSTDNSNGRALPPQASAPHSPAPEDPVAMPATKYMGAYMAAVDTLLETRVYALRKGLALDIHCEDVRCLAATILIDSKGNR